MSSSRVARRGLTVIDRWCVYIIECRTKDLYVGVSSNLNERIKKHNAGTACRYTKFRKPVKLIYSEVCSDYRQARKRESQIKKYSRIKKLELADKLKDLSS